VQDLFLNETAKYAALGYPMDYCNAAEILDEIASLTPTFTGVSFAHLDQAGSVQWP
jgi:formate dehydrogenase major subunit